MVDYFGKCSRFIKFFNTWELINYDELSRSYLFKTIKFNRRFKSRNGLNKFLMFILSVEPDLLTKYLYSDFSEIIRSRNLAGNKISITNFWFPVADFK